ncbi:hypothetical protein ABW19_dt0209944 [Dactylella cylindrospora]|nr:hypothetical protein ABW19_dt0209944 [Dactylella cylindrospora]
MLQTIKLRTQPVRDFFKRGSGQNDTKTKKCEKAPAKIVKSFTIHPNTRTLELDRQHVLVIQHNRHDSIILEPSLNFTIQQCLYTIFLMQRILPRPRHRERPIPMYPRQPQLSRCKAAQRYSANFGDIFEGLARICVSRPGGQRVAVQAALVKPPGGPNVNLKLIITLCGDDLDHVKTVAYLGGIWQRCQRLRELYSPVMRRLGKPIPCASLVRFRQTEKEIQELIVSHMIERIKRRVMKWHNKLCSITQEFLGPTERKTAAADMIQQFVQKIHRYSQLLHKLFEPYKAISMPTALYQPIRLILSEFHRELGSFLRESFPWEAGHPDRRDLVDYSIFTLMDNVIIKTGYSSDGFLPSKYMRKLLEPIILAKRLIEATSDWRWRKAFAADALFKVVDVGQRKAGDETLRLKGTKQAKEMFRRILAKETPASILEKKNYNAKVGNVWSHVKWGLSPCKPPVKSITHQKLHPECELAERYCYLSTFDFRTVKSQEELERVEPTPYMSIAISKPPCRGCKAWFMAYNQRVRSSEEACIQRPRKLQPLYLAYANSSDLVDTTDYNWIAPKLEHGLDLRVKEWMGNQLRLQAINMAGLTWNLCVNMGSS